MEAMKIILIHGAGMDGSIYRPLASRLSGARRVEACTLPGHGTAAQEPLLMDIESMAVWVQGTQMDAPCIVVGHSMGALVAIEASDDARVAGVVLIGAAARMPVNGALLATAHEKPEQARAMVMKWAVYQGADDLESVNAAMAKSMSSCAEQAMYSDLNACDRYTGAEERLKRLKKPLLVIQGENDKMVKEADARALAALAPQTVCKVISGCGHMPMLEKTAETADAMEQFFETLPG